MLASSRKALAHGFSVGLGAARENLLPGLLIQALMLLLVIGYYLHWPTTWLLDVLARAKAAGGLWFAFFASGFCGGVLSELCLVYLLQKGRWLEGNFESLVFKFFLIGLGGAEVSLFYAWLAHVLGNQAEWHVVVAKVLLDQFGFTMFVACPSNAIAIHWKNARYRAAAWLDFFTPKFLGEQFLPLLLVNWCFWIPTTGLIYSLPLALQLPLFLLALAIWGLLLISTMARRHPEIEAVQG